MANHIGLHSTDAALKGAQSGHTVEPWSRWCQGNGAVGHNEAEAPAQNIQRVVEASPLQEPSQEQMESWITRCKYRI